MSTSTAPFDAIVVGARCAGASTAMLLARRGHRVLLVDRSRFPSDLRLSTHLVWQPGVARLERWGLREQVARSGCPPIVEGTVDFGDFVLTGRVPPAGDVEEAYAPRRRVLDTILVEAAVRAGVELWDGCTVDGLLTDGDERGEPRVTGITGRTGGRTRVTASAPVVIGADGMRSVVARLVDAPAYLERPALNGTWFSYWSGLGLPHSTLYVRPYRTVAANPTNDGLTVVGLNCPVDEFRRHRSDVGGFVTRTVEECAPELADRLRSGTREERWSGAAVPSFFRRPSGPGWALVGDAGYVKDPCTAQGITDAFSSAELLAEAVDDALRGRRGWGEALSGYQRRRDEAAMPMYEFTYAQSSLEPPPPEMRELLASLAGDPDAASGFFGVFAGTVPVQALFGAPEPASSAA
ncbi:NAD(P)/FAD-dependent oxidoreductase [Geodermatophilus sp. YIM 151500]|uniref:NAD(P)/FAD-dependent oxidoreductase n=1 Tax=Geodermatophilus sp. YIM 151500 TaxID=2984531 RepID=UPI0021E47277|nr:NAD(P)/FAD-dependent oxidoreductase [Geodermatophilus sp. YIM 151500]MCV2487759.1 NAD(P)/FAD-dependent oxidoreductase [Geodermatophilus sp. YIM 151500]